MAVAENTAEPELIDLELLPDINDVTYDVRIKKEMGFEDYYESMRPEQAAPVPRSSLG